MSFPLEPPNEDGLPTLSVGRWAADKHHFLRRYIDAFTRAMKNKPWNGIHYVELFAGPGVVREKDSGRLFWGSPLIAAQAPTAFTRLHFCERVKENAHALRTRLQRLPQPEAPQVWEGDANELVHLIIEWIPRRALTLCFLDPYGLHLDYETVHILSNIRSDLVIFFPDHVDALRNWEIYEVQYDSRLTRFLGRKDWPERLKKSSPERHADILQYLYYEQLQKLGYDCSEEERILGPRGPLYKLLFFSRSTEAARIWRGTSQKRPGGQWRLFT